MCKWFRCCVPCYQGFDKENFDRAQIYVQLISIVAGVIGYIAVKQSLKDFGDLKEAFTKYDQLFTSPSILDMTLVGSNDNCPSNYESISSSDVKPTVNQGCYCYFNASSGNSLPAVKVDDSSCSSAVQNGYNMRDCFFLRVNNNQAGKNYETFYGKKLCIKKGAPSFSDMIHDEMQTYYENTNCSDNNSYIARGVLRMCPNSYSTFPITDIVGYDSAYDLFYNEFIDNRTIAFGDYFTQQSYYTEKADGKLHSNLTLNGTNMLVFARNEGWGLWPLQGITIARNRPCLESEDQDYFTNLQTFTRYSPFFTYNSDELVRTCSAENEGYYLVNDNDEVSELYEAGDIDLKFWNKTGIMYSSDESINIWQNFLGGDFFEVPNVYDDNFNQYLDLTTYNGLYVQTAGIFNVNNFYRCSQFFAQNFYMIGYLDDLRRTFANLKESGELNNKNNDILFKITIATLAYKSFLSFVMILLNFGCIWKKRFWWSPEIPPKAKEESGKEEEASLLSKFLDSLGIIVDWLLNLVMLFIFSFILQELDYQKGELDYLMAQTEIVTYCWRSDILYTIKLSNYGKIGDLIDGYRLPWISCLVTTLAGFFYVYWPAFVECYKRKCEKSFLKNCSCCLDKVASAESPSDKDNRIEITTYHT